MGKIKNIFYFEEQRPCDRDLSANTGELIRFADFK